MQGERREKRHETRDKDKTETILKTRLKDKTRHRQKDKT